MWADELMLHVFVCPQPAGRWEEVSIMKNAVTFGGVSRALHVVDARPPHAERAAHAAATPAAAAQSTRRTATAASVDGGTV
jgi:hypothetical protein